VSPDYNIKEDVEEGIEGIEEVSLIK